jgi:K+-transporting ATPase A subunit
VSLGVTASGKVDIETEQLDLNGTVIPMYALNSALGRIPLVGGVFSGGEKGGGLFAANYRLSGPFEDPQFSVNPISALAPSFLRELFSASDPQGKGPSSPSVPMELDGHP